MPARPDTHGIRGLASVFGNLDAYDTVVDRGAFSREVQAWRDGKTLPLVSRHATLRHPTAEPLGVVTHLEETREGLYFEARVDDTPAARDVLAHVESGASGDASFSFQPTRSYTEKGRAVLRRSALYSGPWWENGGQNLWAEYSAQADADTNDFRLVLTAGRALQMVRAAKKIKGYRDEVWGVGALHMSQIEHYSDLTMKELGPSPSRMGANPRAYSEVFDLGEAKEDNQAAPYEGGKSIAGAIASATQEIKS